MLLFVQTRPCFQLDSIFPIIVISVHSENLELKAQTYLEKQASSARYGELSLVSS